MAMTNNQQHRISIGFVGLGDMGAPMASNLLDGLGLSECQLHVYDLHLQQDRVPKSASVCGSVAEVARHTEVVFISVPDGDSSLSVVEGLLAEPDSCVRCVVNLSTVGIPATEKITDLIPENSFEYVDAPVSGGKTGAINGTITVMWSGSKHQFDVLQPVLNTFAKSVFYVGDKPGQGQALKLLNNFLSGVALTATSEAVRFGLHHGLDLKTLLDVVHVSTGQNTAVSDKFPKRILTETYDAGFRMALMQKDISLYQQSIEAAGLPSNILAEVARYWEQGVEHYPEGDFTEIFKLINVD